ncbi:amidase [Shinella sp. M27]|uniref:amidase n=1 Tax=Shinella sp. M27 TaxID=3368614 RepID=UPI003BA1230C
MLTSRIPAGPMSDAPELCRLNSTDLANAYRDGSLSPVEVVSAGLSRAGAIQGQFNAFTFIDVDGAIAAAQASEERWRRGEPLSAIDGIPTTVKDIVNVEGWCVRYGSKTTGMDLQGQDAPSVARLRKAGAVFIGQTTTSEYGWKAVTDSRLFGITRNPWNPELTPGGSSGGAAVAAACGAGVLHLGTDGGGSVRIPASFTGVIGHKPTYGRIALHPPSSFGTVAHIGPLGRSVADVALMVDIMSGRDQRDWTQPPLPFNPVVAGPLDWQGKRIGYWKTPCVGHVDPQIAASVEAMLADIEAAGADLVEIYLPDQETLLEVYNRHWYVGAANRLSGFDPARWHEIDVGLIEAARIGNSYSAVERMDAELRRGRYGAAMDALLAEYDFVISPTTPILPFEAGRDVPLGWEGRSWVEWCSFSFPINLSQQPACSIPCGLSLEGLPIGLQIIGARGEDAAVLSAAIRLEEFQRAVGAGR